MRKELDVFVGVEEETFRHKGLKSLFVGEAESVRAMADNIPQTKALFEKYGINQIFLVATRVDFFLLVMDGKQFSALIQDIRLLSIYFPDLKITIQLSLRQQLIEEYASHLSRLVVIPNLHILATAKLPPSIAVKCSLKLDEPSLQKCHVLDYTDDPTHTTRYSQYDDTRIDILQELGLK
jgi:hypothetical protein